MTKQSNISKPIYTREEYCAYIEQLHIPRYEELPAIELYMDQLLTYIDSTIKPLFPQGEKLLTSSMVNNYVKQGIVPTPHAKRYTQDHIAYLIAVCLMKRSFSMQDILTFINLQIQTKDLPSAYNFLCSVIERTLQILFNESLTAEPLNSLTVVKNYGQSFSLTVEKNSNLTKERQLAISAGTCAANKIFVEKELEFIAQSHQS